MSTPPVPAARDHLQRIRRVSRLMVAACVALVGVLPVLFIVYWATTNASELAQQGNLASSAIQQPLQAWQRWAGAAVTAVPLAMLLTGVWQAKRCFAQFAQGQVFTQDATALSAVVAGAVTSVLLTLGNPPGARQLAVGINTNHLFTLFFAALVWLMADVIGQGQALAEENERFV